jgi:hypothetical protein
MQIESFHLAQFGPRLGTRMEGEQAHAQLLTALRLLPDGGQLRIDLEGLDVLSTSFADEVIGKAVDRLTQGEFGERSLVLVSPSLELADGVDAKLAQRQLAMLCLTEDGTWHLLGAHTPAMHETLALILEKRKTTTRELAEKLDLQMNACVNRVARLAKLHLIRREEVGRSGPQPVYALYSILES